MLRFDFMYNKPGLIEVFLFYEHNYDEEILVAEGEIEFSLLYNPKTEEIIRPSIVWNTGLTENGMKFSAHKQKMFLKTLHEQTQKFLDNTSMWRYEPVERDW